MFGANAMWGLLSPISKVIMASGAITPLVVTDLRIGGAMVLFWAASFFNKPEHVSHKDLATLFFASLLAIVFNQGCFVFGVSLTSPGDASPQTASTRENSRRGERRTGRERGGKKYLRGGA